MNKIFRIIANILSIISLLAMIITAILNRYYLCMLFVILIIIFLSISERLTGKAQKTSEFKEIKNAKCYIKRKNEETALIKIVIDEEKIITEVPISDLIDDIDLD